jgi:hypothetical protein
VVLVWTFRRELRDPEAADDLERSTQRFIVSRFRLGWAKLAVAKPEPGSSRDSVLTVAAATLAGVVLAALFVNSALNWWWADFLAAPVIAAAPVAEATRITVSPSARLTISMAELEVSGFMPTL